MPIQNWRDILPGKLALDQESWERHYQIWRMKQAGLPISEITSRMGVGASRAYQMLKRARRMNFKSPCPAELYLSRQDVAAVEKLSKFRSAYITSPA